jgi:tetratricopeptide (TPR) repeat protein
MLPIRRTALAALLGALIVPTTALAQGVIRPMPEPDLSALPANQRQVLVEVREEFEAERANLVGLYLAEGFAQLSGYYARFGLMPAAHAAIDNAIAVAPEDGRFPYLKGVYLLREDKLAEARTQFAAALALDQTYLPIRYRLATAQVALGDLAGARATLEPVFKQRPELAPAPALLADIALRQKRHADAATLFRAALKADPTANSLQAGLADALAAGGDTKGAAEARALVGPGLASFSDPLVEGIFGGGPRPVDVDALALAAAGRHADAIAMLDEGLKVSPSQPLLLAAKARVEADRGNAAAAREAIAEALRLAPKDPGVLLADGLVAELAGDRAKAERSYVAAITADPTKADARLAYGTLLQRLGRHADALREFRELAKLEGLVGWQHAAAAAALANRCGELLREVAAAVRANPRDGGLAQVQSRVAASCKDATDEDRRAALTVARRLYGQFPDAAHAETLAMAHAALGQYDDALAYQMQAGFELMATGGEPAALVRKPFVDAFKAKRAVSTPWPPADPLMAPPALAPQGAPAPTR